MAVGSFVYHSMFKFGVVVEENDDVYKINFQNNGIKELNKMLVDSDKNSFLLFNKKATESIESESLSETFYNGTVVKGQVYQSSGRIKDYRITRRQIEARVEGTYDYLTTFDPQTMLFKCSCPVGIKCKHAAAVALDLEEIYRKLTDGLAVIDSDAANALPEDVRESVKALGLGFNNVEPRDVMNVREYLLNNRTVSAYLNVFNAVSKGRDAKKLLSMIVAHTDEIYKVLKALQSDSRIQTVLKEYKDINTMHNNRYISFSGENTLRCLLDDDYSTALYYSISREYNYNDFSKRALRYLLDTMTIDDKMLKVVDILGDKISSEELIKIYEKLGGELKDAFVKLLYKCPKADALFDYLPLDGIYEVLDSAPSGRYKKYFINNFDKLFTDKKKCADVLYSYYDYLTDREASKIIKKLEKYGYYAPFIDMLTDGTYNSYEIPVSNVNTTVDSNVRKCFDELFSPNYVITIFDQSDVEAEYRLMICDRIFFKLVKRGAEYDVNTKLHEKYIGSAIGYAIEKVESDSEFQNKYNAALEKTKKARLAKLNQKIDGEIDAFLMKLKPHENVYTEVFKAELEVSLDFAKTGVSFKIGNKKMYIVKDVNVFLQYFRKGETITYGKSLVFTHSINNLKSPYDEVVKLLLDYGCNTSYSNTRLALLSNGMFTRLLDILKGRVVYLKEEPYVVSLEEIDLKCYITKDYTIESNVKNYNRLILPDCVYLVDFENHRIDKLKAAAKDLPLVNLIEKLDGVSFETKKDKLRDLVYSRYQDKFEISPEVQADFKLSEVVINAYFDIVGKGITLKSEYMKENVKVDRASLTDYIDKNKLDLYDNYISSLGFDAGILFDEGSQLEFYKLDFEYLKTLANVFLSDSITNKTISQFATPPIRIQYKNSMVEAFLEESQYSETELIEILKAIKRKKKFVLLNGNQIVDLSSDETQEFYQALTDVSIDVDSPFERHQIPTYQAIKAYAHEANCRIDDYLINMIEEIKDFKNAKFPLPKLDATLRSYQKEGFNWLSILKKYHMGGILADDMGLGKTLQIISLIAASKEERPSLVVCPKSLVFNWKTEFNRFAEYIDVIQIYGNANDRIKIINSIDPNKKCVYITSYDSMGRDIDYYTGDFEFLIIDEAQAIKNVKTKKALKVKQIKAAYRYALTGTPIENNILDLWSIFDFLMPEYFEEISAFKSRYESEKGFISEISKKIAPFILRRNKKDVLKDLPSKYERIITCQMGEEQQKVYDSQCYIAQKAIENGGKTFDLLPLLTRLRQICVDPSTFIEDYKSGSAKMDMLHEIIDEYVVDHKILIFSQFVKALNIVEDYLNEKHIKYYMLTGATKGEERIELTNKFNNDDTKIFLISLKAGGVGLNLTGADTVIHLDPWWNISAMNQATDRAHRIGQKRNVEEIKLICENSIEQRVIELQNQKKDIIDKVISDDDSSLTNLSTEDLKFILK